MQITANVGSAADPTFRESLISAAKRLGIAAKYRSAGTVEFLVDQDTHKFYFLEVNTRLQVGFYISLAPGPSFRRDKLDGDSGMGS